MENRLYELYVHVYAKGQVQDLVGEVEFSHLTADYLIYFVLVGVARYMKVVWDLVDKYMSLQSASLSSGELVFLPPQPPWHDWN